MAREEKKALEWVLREVLIKDLKEHPKNPRQIKKEMFIHLERSVSKYGLIDKPIINQDMVIIGGHQRIKLLKKQKFKSVICWFPDRLLSDAEVEELLIGNNLHRGEWDWDALANNFDVLHLLQMGFAEEQLMGQMKEVQKILSETNEEEKPATKKKKMCPNCGCEF